MTSNLDRYKKDLESLLEKGESLSFSIRSAYEPDEFGRILRKTCGDKAKEVLQGLPVFEDAYQPWYSEAKALIKQLLPDPSGRFRSTL
jgi:hypothetical protein